MNKLFAANLLRLKKDRLFWGSVIFVVLINGIYPIIRYMDMVKTGYRYTLDNGFFICALLVPIALSLFVSAFVGCDYHDGTIRNKISIGHRRIDIYLVNLMSGMLVSTVLSLFSFVVNFCIGYPLLGFFDADVRVILFFVFMEMMLCFACCAIFTMISSLVANHAASAMLCILSCFGLLVIGGYLNARLSEPEYIPSYVMNTQGSSSAPEFQESKNPKYLEGSAKEIHQFLYDFIPGGQMLQCVTMETGRPILLMGYSAIIFIASTAAGLSVFERKDLK